MYEAIKPFNDGKDNAYPYKPTDPYPRKGFTPEPERIKMLVAGGYIREQPYEYPDVEGKRKP